MLAPPCRLTWCRGEGSTEDKRQCRADCTSELAAPPPERRELTALSNAVEYLDHKEGDTTTQQCSGVSGMGWGGV